MKLFISGFLLFLSTALSAQKNVNWLDAPYNYVPIKYTVAHFNLKGPIKTFYSDNVLDIGLHFFNENGNLIKVESNMSPKTFTYNSQQQLIKTVEGLFPVENLYESNKKGQIVKISNSKYGTEVKYNDKGQVIVLNNEKGEKLSDFIYDKEGRVILRNEWWNGKISSYFKYAYEMDTDTLKVTQIHCYSKTDKCDTTTFYWINGQEYRYKPKEKQIVDSHGNPQMSSNYFNTYY